MDDLGRQDHKLLIVVGRHLIGSAGIMRGQLPTSGVKTGGER